MRHRSIGFLALAIISALFTCANAQVDEVSQATGLPIPIGAPVIYGQVFIRNLPRGERRPVIFVYLRNSGINIDKVQTNDQGFYYFLKNPGDGLTLAFEFDGSELGSTMLTAGISNRVRRDVEFDWNALNGAEARKKAGTVNVSNQYNRTNAAEKAFDDAMDLVKEKKATEALAAFVEIVGKDPKDHVAWLMIGTINYSQNKPKEARAAFIKAIELSPAYFLAHLNLGRLELSEQNYQPAIANLLKAVEEEPNSADANHLLGEAYLQSKKGSLAVGYLNKAIELAPVEKADLHLRLAALYHAAGYKSLASAEYAAFLKKVKDYPKRKELEKYIKENPPKP